MSEPTPGTPSPQLTPPVDPRRLAAVLVQRVGRAPLVLGGTVLLLALWTGAFLLSGSKKARGPAEAPVPPASAEQAPGTRELIQRFLDESRRQAAQEAAAARADRYSTEPNDDFSSFPPDYGPRQAQAPPPPTWEPQPEPRRGSFRSDPEPRDPARERLERALEASPLVSAARPAPGGSAEAPVSPMEGLLAATERLAQLAQAPPALGGIPGSFPDNLPAVLQPTAPDLSTASSAPLRPAPGRSLSPYTLDAGSLIPAVLTAAVNSDAPGTVSAVVSHDVYDSRTGTFLLVPAGSRLLGASGSATQGQNRLEITWSRLTLPDGTTYELGAMPAADQAGATGLRDKTNRHLARTFGSALLLSAFTAAAQLSQPDSYSGALRTPTAQEIAAGALGQQVNATAGALIDRELRVPPTLVLRPGMGCNAVVTTDLVFPGPSRR